MLSSTKNLEKKKIKRKLLKVYNSPVQAAQRFAIFQPMFGSKWYPDRLADNIFSFAQQGKSAGR
jgi:hypothetical protein